MKLLTLWLLLAAPLSAQVVDSVVVFQTVTQGGDSLFVTVNVFTDELARYLAGIERANLNLVIAVDSLRTCGCAEGQPVSNETRVYVGIGSFFLGWIAVSAARMAGRERQPRTEKPERSEKSVPSISPELPQDSEDGGP